MDAITRLFYVRKTVRQMLQDRGYLVSAQERDESLEDFKAAYSTELEKGGDTRDNLRLHHRNKHDLTEQIYVFFPAGTKIGVKPIRSYYSLMETNLVQRAIIVAQGMTSFAKQALGEMSPKYKLEQFTETELLVNITSHQLVPTHTKLSKDEKRALLDRYKLKDSQLPRIQVSDPVARYYGLERGEVVKIIRTSETAGKYITYRLVS